MSFVDTAFDLWKDLEISYAQRGKDLSRKDFLLKLIGYSDGKTKLDTLKANVLKEYETNQDKCNILAKTFDAIAENLDVILASDIDDLNVFAGSLVVKHEAVSGSSNLAVPDDFFSSLDPYRRTPGISRISPEQVLLSTDFSTDVFRIIEGRAQGVISDVKAHPEIAVLKRGNSVNDLVSRYKNGDEFLMKVLLLIQSLISKGEDMSYALFFGKSLFSSRGSKVTLTLGDKSVKLDLAGKGKAGDFEYLECTHANGFLETPVYCIL